MEEELKFEEFKDDFPLLIEAGFVAVKQLDEVSAIRIFNAAQTLSPSHTAPRIGLGYIELNKLQIKEATRIFDGVVHQEPDNYLAKTFLGICYLLTKGKRKKGEELIHDSMEKTEDPTVKNLGIISLQWAEKDLYKKSKTAPFFSVESDKEPDQSKSK